MGDRYTRDVCSSVHFGAVRGGLGIDERSFYTSSLQPTRTVSEDPDDFWARPASFDVSNNVVLCSCGPDGLPRDLAIANGLRSAVGGALPGVYVNKSLRRAAVRFSLRRPSAVDLNPSWRGTRLVRGLFPAAEFRTGALSLSTLTFAPLAETRAASPAAVILLFDLENTEGDAQAFELEVETAVWPEDPLIPDDADLRPATVGVSVLAGDLSWDGSALACAVPGGETVYGAVAICLASDSEGLARVASALAVRDAPGWYAQTERLLGRTGALDTGAGGYEGELLLRQVELCRQALLYSDSGSFVGGFWGSDVNSRPGVWMRDNFYSAQAMAWFAPDLCADAAHFYATYALPDRTWGYGGARASRASAVSHSLGNALAPILLAGAYLRATGDVDWMRRSANLYEYGRTIFDRLSPSRWDPEGLFPSVYISDGDARGDWHTGSNVLAWRALNDLADIAEHALRDETAAGAWRRQAVALRSAILEHCSGDGPLGRQLFEGGYRSGSRVAGHDGEESDLTLASFYGFLEADEPLVVRHAKSALTSENPFYWDAGGSVQWWDSGGVCYGATFPAFVHALAGTESEDDLAAVLGRLRTMSDVDGSFWWWPYRPFAHDSRDIERGLGKCGWAAGVFVARMVSDVLGIRPNALTRTVRVRPFSPWSFRWSDCRLGTTALDLSYERSDADRTVRVVNRSESELQVELEVVGPGQTMASSVFVNGRRRLFEGIAVGWFANRRTLVVSSSVAPGDCLQLACGWGDS
jgi:hypothetical protein